MTKQQAEKRGASDFKKHGQGVNCPFKPGWQRGYWLRGYNRALEKAFPKTAQATK